MGRGGLTRRIQVLDLNGEWGPPGSKAETPMCYSATNMHYFDVGAP